MKAYSLKTSVSLSLIVAWILFCSHGVAGQNRCLNDDDVKKMLEQVNSPQAASPNKKLTETLLKLRESAQKGFRNTINENRKPDEVMKRIRSAREKNTSQLCPILKEFGWPTTSMVGESGVEAAFYLLKNASSFDLQRDLLPIIIAVTKKGEIERADFAGYLDRLRLSSGLKQLFGTEVTIRNGFLVLYPITAEAQVDERRRQYGLAPLSDHIRTLERVYKLPLLKSTGEITNAFPETPDSSISRSIANSLFEGEVVGEDEVVRIDTNLVNLNVSVYSSKLKTHFGTLEQRDFAIFEDGQPENIVFFSSTEVPCDLVLLIDLSGSTSGKRDLIRKTTERFITAARPADRVAIVTFTSTTNIVSPLTGDRKQLLERAAEIDGIGASHVWDALKFTLDQVVGPRALDRRRAVVFMTDGADNALASGGLGSRILFGDLVEAVRRTDALIIPIYLDTEGDDPYNKRLYENARKTLATLAEESGGLYYKARKIEDLGEVYAQVLEDLGKVYSLGYKPTNAKRDGTWRNVKILVPNHPELMTQARPGYYAK